MDCVTPGYLDDPLQTGRSYFSFRGESAFRTRDLGVKDCAGNLRILGRLGSMTKINGHRVEFGEVEGVVANIPGIHQAVAFVKENESGVQELFLSIEIMQGCKNPDISEIKRMMRNALPAYMVPKKILFVSEIPLSSNGKVDRNKLANTV